MARYLGIDIGEAAVRAVVLRTRLRGVVVESMREVSVREAGSVHAALRLVAQGPRPDATAVALPGDGLFLRRLELPVTALRELHNVLGFELEATLPIDLAEAVFDHRLPARPAKNAATAVVQAAVARSADVRKLAALVRECTGWEPDLVSAGALPLAALAEVLPGLESPVLPPAAPPPAPPGESSGASAPGALVAAPMVGTPVIGTPVVGTPTIGGPGAPGEPPAGSSPLALPGLAQPPVDPTAAALGLGPALGASPYSPLSPPHPYDPPADDETTGIFRVPLAGAPVPPAEVPPAAVPPAAVPPAAVPPAPPWALPAPELPSLAKLPAPDLPAPVFPDPLAPLGSAQPFAVPGSLPPSVAAPPPAEGAGPSSIGVRLTRTPDEPGEPRLVPAPGPVLLVEVEETRSDLVVLAGGEPVFARTLSRGVWGPSSGQRLARELRQSIAAYRLAGGDALGSAVLVGLGASVLGADAYLERKLGLAVRTLPRPRLDGVPPELEARLPRFARALGLALSLTSRTKSFNLRTGSLAAEEGMPFLREKLPVLVGLGAVLVASFAFSWMSRSRSLDAQLASAEADLGAITQEVLGEALTDPDAVREVLEKGPAAEDDPLPRADAFDVMVQLAKVVPKDVVHDVIELEIQRGHVVLQGAVPGVSDAQQIAEGLKTHACIKDMKGVRTSQFGNDRQKYTIEFDLRCRDDKDKAKAAAAGSASAAPRPTSGAKEGR